MASLDKDRRGLHSTERNRKTLKYMVEYRQHLLPEESFGTTFEPTRADNAQRRFAPISLTR
jgi:hypothetical protein